MIQFLLKNYNVELFKLKKDECVISLEESEIRELLFKIVKDMALENPDALMDILYMLLSDSWVMK